MISIIVAIAENGAIGRNNELLWHIPEDLRRFKRITLGHKIIMGKKTYESLPVSPLPERTNIVISDDPEDAFNGCKMAYSIEEALTHCSSDEECFIIGGGTVYQQFLPLADRLYITRVHSKFEADTFFPEIDLQEWEMTDSQPAMDENRKIEYSFVTNHRKKQHPGTAG